ncbi:MAG TPA: DUF692 domain-containing protein [Pseudonocardiaceae bacterium]|jgi:hypothetical protein|nr:DUF692 domain-containing protein [Pseudonocardiaceae bacterium]
MSGGNGPAIGIGWRPEIDLTVESLPGLDFVEVIAEGVDPARLPESLRVLRSREISVVPHSVSLSLGGAAPPDPARLDRLAEVAHALDAPLVSDHVAFVRSGDRETGHLMPVPRTREALDVVVANVRAAQERLGLPLAVENIAALLAWPEDELTEAQFLTELLDRTGALLLLDVANLYAVGVNFGADPAEALDELPLERVAYVHVAGGVNLDGIWHDTHTHPVTQPILDVLAAAAQRAELPAVMLERDGNYPSPEDLAGELTAIRQTTSQEQSTSQPRGFPTPAPIPAPAPEPPPAVRARTALAGGQARLATALAEASVEIERFDLGRVRVQRSALVRKRSRAVARHAPTVARLLGDRLDSLFAEYADAQPKPSGDALADVDAFLAHLRATGRLRGRRRPRLVG